MILDERKPIVRDGYDELAPRFRAWAEAVEGDREHPLEELASRLPGGAQVLDLGCGSGVPKTQRLAKPS